MIVKINHLFNCSAMARKPRTDVYKSMEQHAYSSQEVAQERRGRAQVREKDIKFFFWIHQS